MTGDMQKVVYALKIKYNSTINTWTQYTQKTENKAIRKRPAISNKVTRLNQLVSLMCVGGRGQLLVCANCAFSSLARETIELVLATESSSSLR